jgi:DNA-binding NtrC family response regulator
VCHGVSLLVLSEDPRICNLIGSSLDSEGHRAICVSSVESAVKVLKENIDVDLLLYDANIGKDPTALFSCAIEHRIQPKRICILTEVSDLRWKAHAQRWNINNVLTRPLLRHDLEKLIAGCEEVESIPPSQPVQPSQPALPVQAVLPKDASFQLEELGPNAFFLAASPAMMRIYREIRTLSAVNYPVLILGESGVGKEIVARMLHKYHVRAKEPFFNINTAAIPSELLESELFGYEVGAFTGAVKAKPGKFELANNGTLLLDEIGEMSMQMQTKLLHVLQDGTFSRLGAHASSRTDVRILAATNVNMEKAIEEKRFREDLYYRLNTFTVTVPPLRSRPEEIPLLIDQMMMRGAAGTGIEPFPLTSSLMEAAQEYNWPGNLRELRNFVHRLLVLRDQEAAYSDLGARTRTKVACSEVSFRGQSVEAIGSSGRLGMKSVVSDVKYETEARMIKEALSASGWNRRRAANNLNISYRSLLYKIQQHNITA